MLYGYAVGAKTVEYSIPDPMAVYLPL